MRRDLDLLERRGAIRRVHGGAVSVESRLDESLFEDKASLAVREKRRIAEAALKFIGPGDTIYLDGGILAYQGGSVTVARPLTLGPSGGRFSRLVCRGQIPQRRLNGSPCHRGGWQDFSTSVVGAC